MATRLEKLYSTGSKYQIDRGSWKNESPHAMEAFGAFRKEGRVGEGRTAG
jgi:hypothetical protein